MHCTIDLAGTPAVRCLRPQFGRAPFVFVFCTLYCSAACSLCVITFLKSFSFNLHLLNASRTGICNVFSNEVPCAVFAREAVPVAAGNSVRFGIKTIVYHGTQEKAKYFQSLIVPFVIRV